MEFRDIREKLDKIVDGISKKSSNFARKTEINKFVRNRKLFIGILLLAKII